MTNATDMKFDRINKDIRRCKPDTLTRHIWRQATLNAEQTLREATDVTVSDYSRLTLGSVVDLLSNVAMYQHQYDSRAIQTAVTWFGYYGLVA